MRYCWNLKREPEDGAIPGPCPARLYDADGQEIDLPVVWVDTETGEVRHHAMDADGVLLTNADDTAMLRATTWARPPLRLVPENNPVPDLVIG